MIPIYFFSEEISFKPANTRLIKNWLDELIFAEGLKIENINFIFCTDDYLHKINVEYLDHDTLTDIITFQYNKKGEPISSDIYISIEMAKSNARELGISFINELHRLLAHGTLHLCGYKDKSKPHKKLMTQKEDYYLSLRPQKLVNKD